MFPVSQLLPLTGTTAGLRYCWCQFLSGCLKAVTLLWWVRRNTETKSRRKCGCQSKLWLRSLPCGLDFIWIINMEVEHWVVDTSVESLTVLFGVEHLQRGRSSFDNVWQCLTIVWSKPVVSILCMQMLTEEIGRIGTNLGTQIQIFKLDK